MSDTHEPVAFPAILSKPQWPRAFRYFKPGRTTAASKAARFILKIDPLAISIRRNHFDGQDMVAVNYIGRGPSRRPKLARTKHLAVTYLDNGTAYLAEYCRVNLDQREQFNS